MSAPEVMMTSEATGALTRLSTGDLRAVGEALKTLDGSEPRATEPQSGGKSYHVRKVRNASRNLRIYYRLMDKSNSGERDKWVVVAIGD